MKVCKWIIVIALMCGCIQFGMWIGKMSVRVKDWNPRMNYVKFFKEERGMKDPRFFGIAIKNGLLRVYFSNREYPADGRLDIVKDGEFRVDEDMIPIELIK